MARNGNAHVVVGKRKDETRSCEKCRHLERGTRVPDGSLPQREEVAMVWKVLRRNKYETTRNI